MSIYTGGGDRGMTGLLSGQRVAKSHALIEAGGAVDELNSCLGLLRARLGERPEEYQGLGQVQARLLDLGACLSADTAQAAGQPAGLGPPQVAELEAAIDQMEQELPTLESFILPGGTPAAALCHLARAVCRRAERRVVSAIAEASHQLPPAALAYLNRLSDYLFVLARQLNHRAGQAETPWPG